MGGVLQLWVNADNTMINSNGNFNLRCIYSFVSCSISSRSRKRPEALLALMSMLTFSKDGLVNGCLRCRAVKLVYQITGCIKPFLKGLLFPISDMVICILNLHGLKDRFVKTIISGLLAHPLKLNKITMMLCLYDYCI